MPPSNCVLRAEKQVMNIMLNEVHRLGMAKTFGRKKKEDEQDLKKTGEGNTR
jgi:hypothetical protein